MHSHPRLNYYSAIMEYILVITTTSTKSNANIISKKLIHHKIAACVNIVGNVTSSYIWKGRVTKSKEYLCLVKAEKRNYQRIEKEIRKVHKYQLPEIICIPFSGSKEYLAWISS